VDIVFPVFEAFFEIGLLTALTLPWRHDGIARSITKWCDNTRVMPRRAPVKSLAAHTPNPMRWVRRRRA